MFVVDLGVESIRDEDGGNMSDAIIPALKHRIPSVVLGWVTSWEVLVLHSFFIYFLRLVAWERACAMYLYEVSFIFRMCDTF